MPMHPTVRIVLLIASLIGVVAPAQTVRAQEGGKYAHYNIHDRDLLPNAEYAGRRATVMKSLGGKAAMLVRSADQRMRSGDVDYEFRQRNSMLYLTGVTEESSALLLIPQGVRVGDSVVHELLFVAARTPKSETWDGVRMGPAIAPRITGIANVVDYDELTPTINTLIASIDTLYYDGWLARTLNEPLTGEMYPWETSNTAALRALSPDIVVKSASQILDAMRAIKSPAEIALMQRAVEISCEAHRETIRAGKPGMHEYELEAIMEYTFRRLGAEDPGYPSIVGSGPNTCILHYSDNRRQTQAGELVLMDCGAEYHGYSSDVTRTFPVDGRFTDDQRTIYDIVFAAQTAGIAACRAGKSFRDPHVAAMNVIADGLTRLGIIGGPDEAQRYFPHGTSHFLGLDVHDVGRTSTLRPGMVLTVEPGIYIPAGSPCDARWWNIGIRIEDDILVTDNDPHNLSESLARTAEQIEALMQMGTAAGNRREP